MGTGTVTVIGSYNVGLFYKADRLPAPGETVIGDRFWEGGGGKGSNQAVAASRLGAHTRFIGRIGEDNYGANALEMYQRLKIRTNLVHVDASTHTGISVIFVDRNGNNMIIVLPGANFNLSADDIDRAEQAISESFIVGCQLESRPETVAYALRKAHSLGVMTLLDPAPAAKLPDDLFPAIDIIKPNETEATVLTGIPVKDVDSAAQAGRWLLDRGVRTALVTLGEGGSVLVRSGLTRHFPAPKVEATDSTGAGDIFSGGLMAALARGDSLEAAVRFATCAAAISVTRLGVIDAIPEPAEVEAMLAR